MIGGAQQAMHDLLIGFSRSGVDVTVICPEVKEDNRDLLSVENVHVLPVLKEVKNRPLFPHEHLYNVQRVAELVQAADIVWTLDYAFPIQVPQPIVLTLDNFTYDEEMRSLLDLNWDMLIVPSDYLRRIAQAVVGPEFWDGAPRPIEVVPYAVDTTIFKPTPVHDLCEKLGLSKADRYLLFPHRPDPDKGFDSALRTLQHLRHRGDEYKLLIPINETYKADKRYYRELRTRAAGMGIGPHVIFHQWIDLVDLPAYYSLGAWTLALGTFPEGFGLTPVQSINCGTPVVSTRAGALAGQFPSGHGVAYVDFNAVDQIVSNISNGVPRAHIAKGQEYAREKYSVERLVRNYLECFEKAQKSDASYNPLGADTPLRLSPWCHLMDESNLWHDYLMRALKLTRKEIDLIRQIKNNDGIQPFEDYRVQLTKLLNQGVLLGKYTDFIRKHS
jgi:glycosyltransferase involved in cell wall biosynthesis